jgi:hypothetical protein
MCLTAPGAITAIIEINGKPTLFIRHADGSPAIVVSLQVSQGRVQSIWAVANPDKLGWVSGA